MPTRKLLLILNRTQWPSLDAKLAEFLKPFSGKLDLRITLRHSDFSTIPFSDYVYPEGTYKEINKTWYDDNISRQAAGFNYVAFYVPRTQWLSTKHGFRADRNLGPIEVQFTSDENEVLQFPNGGKIVNAFVYFLQHEIAHCLYMEAEQPDRTHEFWDKYHENFLKYVLEDVEFKEPHPADEATGWQLFWATLIAFFTGSGVSKEDQEKTIDVIADELHIPKPDKPIKKSRLEELALIMEEVEAGSNPNSLARRLNNPGAIVYRPWQKQYGASPAKNGFAAFPTYAQGKQAQLHLLKAAFSDRMTVYRGTMTLDQFIRVYASTSPEIEKQNYIRRVSTFLNVPPTIMVKQLL